MVMEINTVEIKVDISYKLLGSCNHCQCLLSGLGDHCTEHKIKPKECDKFKPTKHVLELSLQDAVKEYIKKLHKQGDI
jgi:hypothetical protein